MLWDDDDDAAADVAQEAFDLGNETAPLDFTRITSVRYEHGFVKRLEDAEREGVLALTEWLAPAIPPHVTECLERERIDLLEGDWGNPTDGTPVQIELVDVVTEDGDSLSIDVYNRALLLLRTDDPSARAVHRVCETLRRAAEGRAEVILPPPGDLAAVRPRVSEPVVDVDALLKSHRRQPGTCALCGIELSRNAVTKHCASCAPAHDAGKGPLQGLIQLRVTSAGSPAYWLELEIRESATLAALDAFLREIWVECCGHLSMFSIGDIDYTSQSEDFGFGLGFGRRRARRSMATPLARALPAAHGRFDYEYDFGSTTRLQLEVRGRREGRIGRAAVRLLARNGAPVWPCAVCGMPADVFDCEGREYPFVCSAHAPDVEDAPVLPVVNSPRVGVCAYGADT